MAWIQSDPELVARRVSEARIDLVMLLFEAGYSPQRVADITNAHFEELVVLTECMGDWTPRVLAQAMCYRATRDDSLEVIDGVVQDGDD
jgi:hypothetical protein